MEVKEIFKLEDGTGRQLSVHLTEHEVITTLQAGLFYLIQQGYVNYKRVENEVNDIELPPDATAQ